MTESTSVRRPPTVIITRAEAGALLDNLPALLATASVTAGERDTLEGLYQHLVRFFKGEANY